MKHVAARYVDVIEAHAEHSPGRRAVHDQAGWTTYGELWASANRVARALRRADVERGDTVAIALDSSATYVECLLGVMLAGAVACPLNTRLTGTELVGYLEPIQPRAALVDPAHAAALADLGGDVIDAPGIVHAHTYDGSPLPGDPAAEHDPAIIFGTGGTTGLPKGAVWTHRNLWLYAASCALNMEVRPTDVELFFSPPFHIALVTGPLATLYTGGAVRFHARFDEERAVADLCNGRATRLFGAPEALVRIVEHPNFDSRRADAVRRVLFGGTGSSPGFARRLQSCFPKAELVYGYGATEFGAVARLRTWELTPDRERGLGRPVPGARIEIVDDDGNPLQTGMDGEIAVRTPWQMSGYWNNADETVSILTPSGAIRSGDLGHLDEEGNLHLTGRLKDMIITGAENVFPAEIEQVLDSHPDVRDVAVYGVPDPEWGERVQAAVVASAPGALSEDALRDHCRSHLAGYKVPKRIVFVDALPRTPTLKVDRRRLQAEAQHG